MTQPQNSVYVERRTYRRRRLVDAVRLLPIFGVLLFLVPILWSQDDAEPTRTANGVVYVFAIWAMLIVVAAWFSRRLGTGGARAEDQDKSG